ncbi:hypothetical protein [Carboxylicivirga sp. M1479]|uniref:hypothetical protein n=1 Tax=Carboxylicivirga sp. M1479 TaxID=2594476 RepID=UPI001178757C|nr:hypothetical protein [Carboxylicivirga sp. M1479]TRX72506.1 hypothetical protein FNN09_00780 [Carboxylicivirga sp. M1479]
MRKLTLLLAALLIGSAVHAQSFSEEVDLFQAAFGMEKKAIVEYFVNPADANKEAFWEVYDEYEAKRKELGKQRLDVLMKYANTWETMSDDQADAFMKDLFKLKASTDKLIKSYYKKMRKATTPSVGAQFFQVESYILTVVRFHLQESIPFIAQDK